VALVEIVLSLQQGRGGWAQITAGAFSALAVIALVRGFYRVRTVLIFALSASYLCTTLLLMGIAGAGRLHLLFFVVLAAVLLPPRRAIVISSLACLLAVALLMSMSAGLLPMPPEIAARAVEPQTIIINTLGLLIFAVATIWLILTLIARLTRSLNDAEAALGEHDALNSHLEELVAERTRALERQLALQGALARCSRILMECGGSPQSYEQTLVDVLAIIREAVGGDNISVAQYTGPDQGVDALFRSFRTVAQSCGAGATYKRPPSREEILDMPPALNVWKTGRGFFNGPVGGRFPAHPHYQRYLDENQVQAVVIQALLISGQSWGHILLIDNVQPRTWGDAEVQALQTVAEMIISFTEGWEAARALHEREMLLRSINDALPDGYLYQVIQRDDASYEAYTYVSAGVERLLGVTPTQVLADYNLLHRSIIPDDRAQVDAADKESIRTRGTFDVELRRRKADGSVGWFHIRSVPHMDLPGGRTLWSGICLEVTARKEVELELARAKEAAEAADAAKSAFLANISHEIRTPLNAVIGMADLLLDTELSASQRTYAATIGTAGQALFSVISDVLDLSRIESGRLELEAQSFDLHRCLTEARDLVAHMAHEKGLGLGFQIAAGVPGAVIGDGPRLRQVVINLLSNAVKFTAAGEVTLEATAAPPHDDGRLRICIAVRDSGIGIAADQMAQIFDPFVQADRSTSRRYGGTGLGLAICRQLVEMMGGRIGVESAPGLGSTFTVCLPLAAASLSARAAGPADGEHRPVASLRILVVEDNPINQMVTRQMLSGMGCQVAVVASGQAAIDALAEVVYDVVLMDVQMPEMDGEEATRQIRRGHGLAQPYIIALTADALPGDRERLMQAGMDDYLSKPVRATDLRRALAGAPRAGAPS
jgi:PAS domain S-box-containing protein